MFLLRARHGDAIRQGEEPASIEEREIRNMTSGAGDIAICGREHSEPVHRGPAALDVVFGFVATANLAKAEIAPSVVRQALHLDLHERRGVPFRSRGTAPRAPDQLPDPVQ